MTITDEQHHELTCNIQRSVRYHRARERFFESWSNLFSFLSLLAGTSVVVALIGSAPQWIAISAGVAVAAMQACEQVFRLSAKARDHSGFASEFSALERQIVLTEEVSGRQYQELQAEKLAIEAREPPIKRYLDLICHNQVAMAIGSDDIEELSFWQVAMAQYLNGDRALQRRYKKTTA